ncbi:MAG: hypothetical protein COV52_09150 [Gammaproteobacteria bacterium CG11_big_fil_rev_8_21_14_0_20_46_22]|nr:MAG: hypothetical protein COW05_01765 [Gammaproteobacteria bacterium CG12_big_fil_rev_8_21_14_0_65_46_12]PIR10444.1 MAG: hypothetical protein COV52_09150 [Gammaproteobacteria bacterium CG11_big_fil_rev_8_21_14_0_20_46_22]
MPLTFYAAHSLGDRLALFKSWLSFLVLKRVRIVLKTRCFWCLGGLLHELSDTLPGFLPEEVFLEEYHVVDYFFRRL